jgi:hypothetical protein
MILEHKIFKTLSIKYLRTIIEHKILKDDSSIENIEGGFFNRKWLRMILEY